MTALGKKMASDRTITLLYTSLVLVLNNNANCEGNGLEQINTEKAKKCELECVVFVYKILQITLKTIKYLRHSDGFKI